MQQRRRKGKVCAIEAVEPRRLLTTLYVDANANGVTHNGSSWATAFLDLQQALSAVTSGDSIRVADGTYKPTATTNRAATFQLKSGVNVSGGYAGVGAPNPDLRDVVANVTTLSGDIGTPANSVDNSYHVVTGTGTNATAMLDGFVVTNGNANNAGISNANCGAGLIVTSGTPTISNCIFTANSATNLGGAVYDYTASPTFSNCTFSANTAAGAGGAMYNWNTSQPSITGCTFTGNSCPTGGAGAIFYNGSNGTLTSCTFSGNSCRDAGGAVHSDSPITLANCTFVGNAAGYGAGVNCTGTSATVSGCTFTDNTANQFNGGGLELYGVLTAAVNDCTFTHNTAPAGGGLYLFSSGPIVTNCTFVRNIASDTGGGIQNNNGRTGTAFRSCTFLGNTAAHNGGGVANTAASSPASFVNSLFVGNQSTGGGVGGAMWNDNTSPSVANCTFTANRSPTGSGGAIGNLNGGSPIITNSILWGDTAQSGNEILSIGAGAVPVVRNSNIQGGWTGTGNISTNPNLVRTPSPGLDSTWGTSDDDYGDIRLRPLSPAVNQGSNSAVPSGITTDLGGNDRIVGGIVDMGAYESDLLIYVDRNASGANSGMSWTDAYIDLATVMSQATSGSTVKVADGIYKPTSGTDRTFAFALKPGIVAMGGFAGAGAANPDARDFAGHPTVLSGDIGIAGVDTDNSYHVVVVGAVDFSAVLDGFTITGGRAEGFDSAGISGGGMLAWAGTPTISNCSFVGNYAYGGGGAINADGSGMHLLNCSFTGNRSLSLGGGIFIDHNAQVSFSGCSFTQNAAPQAAAIFNSGNSTINLSNCSFTSNQADSNGAVYNYTSTATFTSCNFKANYSGDSGAAILNNESSLAVVSSQFTENRSSNGGGAIYNYATSAPCSISDCSFSGNTTKSTNGYGGGAIFIAGSSTAISLLGSRFLDNQALGGGNNGGALFVYNGSLKSVGCTYVCNSVSGADDGDWGGAVDLAFAAADFTNCVFFGNSADEGGAIANDNSSPNIRNCTFTQNSATSGGAIYNYVSSPAIANTILWANHASTGNQMLTLSGSPIISSCDIDGGNAGAGGLSSDPLFIRNPTPGRDGVWGTLDDDYGDLRLRITSPCIDAGDNASVPAGVATDLAGNPRLADVPNAHDPGAIVDMGAYERIAPFVDGEYLYTAARPGVRFAFTAAPNTTSVQAADLMLVNLTMGQPIDCVTLATVSVDAISRSATWTFNTTLLADGNYRATLPSGSVTDGNGVSVVLSDFTFDFFVLAGDANRDRTVDITDLSVLAQNWKGSGKVFSQGDFNYDGKVDAADLGILSTNWQKSLPAPVAPAQPAALVQKTPKRTATRMASLVL